MTTDNLLLIIAALLIVCAVLLVREALKSKAFPNKKPTCKGSHLWRTIAEPYARQCRICGATEFREDKNGGFPDGLSEYFAYVGRLSPEARYIAPTKNICHCGATMVFKADCYVCGGPMIMADDQRTGRNEVWYCRKCDRVADDTEKPIWFCEICESWKVVENNNHEGSLKHDR